MDWAFFEKKFPLLMNSLQNANEAGRLGHSHLVITSNPDYRLRFPPHLAALAACRTPVHGQYCGKCSSCKQILSGLYPDMYTLAPTSKSREIVIGKDADEPDTLRSFEAAFHLSSITESGWKIGIVQDADTMNESAQNAFLKTLEEPPKNCIFILTTGRPAELLPTIRSRCQLLSLTDNKCEYDLSNFQDLPQTLFNLQFAAFGNLLQAEECARSLIGMLSSFYSSAEESVQKTWTERIEAAKNLESAGMKLIEKRMAGEIGCEYRRMREQFTSIVHSWFAQTAMLSAGMDEKLLPNPEILTPYLTASSRPPLLEQEAFRVLNEAESMLRNLRTNVSDALILRTFCLSVAVRT